MRSQDGWLVFSFRTYLLSRIKNIHILSVDGYAFYISSCLGYYEDFPPMHGAV